MSGTYLKIINAASIVLANPFEGNCGGGNLNQYTITLAVTWEQPRDEMAAASAVPRKLMDDDSRRDFARGVMHRREEEEINPVHSFGSSSAEVPAVPSCCLIRSAVGAEPLLSVDNLGFLHTIGGPIGSASRGQSDRPRLISMRLHFISLIVDCSQGVIECVLDGKPMTSKPLSPLKCDMIDGPFSLTGSVFLFGSVSKKSATLSAGGGIRYFSLHPRALLPFETTDLAAALKRESQAGVVSQIVSQLMSMGVTTQVAQVRLFYCYIIQKWDLTLLLFI